jgi:hypothetical protein
MRQRKKDAVRSKQVEKAMKKFDSCRRSRKTVSRIPDNLWESAVLAAREVGVNQAARALGLEYYALKKRVGSMDVTVSKPSGGFIELSPTCAAPFFTEWAVEMENGNGDRMRFAARSAADADVVELCRAFWGAE